MNSWQIVLRTRHVDANGVYTHTTSELIASGLDFVTATNQAMTLEWQLDHGANIDGVTFVSELVK